MRISALALLVAVTAQPALAASGPFFSLGNTDFVVLLGFMTFVAVVIYFKVPALLGGLLDKRASDIRSELAEAKGLREDAQALLASYERKQKDVQEQADRIIASAKKDAASAAEDAKDDLAASIVRRLAAATDQIASAQASAVKEVRDAAITVAIAAANDVIAKQMTAKDGAALIDDAIGEVASKLH